jgi:hypothetical protein
VLAGILDLKDAQLGHLGSSLASVINPDNAVKEIPKLIRGAIA